MLVQITVIHFVETMMVSALVGAFAVAALMVLTNRRKKT